MASSITRLKLASSGLMRGESGQGLVEYALILAFAAIVTIAALTLLGGDVKTGLSSVASTVASATHASH